jgi:predicted nucleic acid-binding protein
MTVVVDTSVLVDVLRGHRGATHVLAGHRRSGRVHASEVVRLELLAGMLRREEGATRQLLSAVTWHPVDEAVAEEAGRLGRRWLPSHSGIDAADLAVAATANLLDASVLTVNVRHFPMFDGLTAPY